MRDVLTYLGALGLCGTLAVIAWAAACEVSERAARRRHRCGECDTLDTSTDAWAWRCTACGRLKALEADPAPAKRVA